MFLFPPLRRSVFALPLLAVSAIGFASHAPPFGARGLVRMPGDLGPLGRRLRCASWAPAAIMPR